MKLSLVKNSARLIGAITLYDMAEKMQAAFKSKDNIYIASHINELLNTYSAFKEKLARLADITQEN